MIQHRDEIERIRSAYQRREANTPAVAYSFFNSANFFMVQSRDREVIEILRKNRVEALTGKKILDVGCGMGTELNNLMRYGAMPSHLFGIDLLVSRIAEARELNHNIRFSVGDASHLPYSHESFNIVVQFTVFTSIKSLEMRRSVAQEMLRVLTSDGIILWYDFHMDNPRNPDVKGVTKSEIFDLFPNCTINLKRITLAPPLVRLLAPYSVLACFSLEKLSIFNTHYIGTIKKS